jgi:hypothetical protein
MHLRALRACATHTHDCCVPAAALEVQVPHKIAHCQIGRLEVVISHYADLLLIRRVLSSELM